MNTLTGGPAVRARARAHAEAAAGRALVEVRALTTNAELKAAAGVLTDVWDVRFPQDVLRAFVLSGNYVSGAFDTGQSMVAASTAFAAIADQPELHSHVTGVLTGRQRSGVGLALKLHQRSWALEREIPVITWTFDPLVRRNAIFNLARLGATAETYLENVYGPMEDALNSDEDSDRLYLRWWLSSSAVEAASSGIPQSLHVEPSLPQALRSGPDDAPLVAPADAPASRRFLCRVPDDIQILRRSSPEVARAWRLALRRVLGGALANGGQLLGVDDRGDYVIENAIIDKAVTTSTVTKNSVIESSDGRT
jgi:predicted GNAT superfamily acetyltransferase